MHEKVSVYLAGPLTGCKPKQATAWRRNLSNLLGKGFKILDPSKEGSRRGAMAVSADVEQADVVIANMWKESIGTALQIAQAQRLGIPVILIDQHYMDHAVLESLVDKTVRGEQEAVNFLQNELSKTLRPELMVIKKTKREPFDFLKLQRSLKACCTVAGVDDVVFCKMLSRQVRRSVLTLATGGSIHSDKLKAAIFENLNKLSMDTDKLNPIDQAEVREKAALVRDQLEKYELLYKSDRKNKQISRTHILKNLIA